MVHDWELTASGLWILEGARTRGDTASITYQQTDTYERVIEQKNEADEADEVVEVTETEDRVDTKTVKHYRTSFDGKLQTVREWESNIKGEIAADLSGLNKVEAAEKDITAKVS